jgi:hypothetical protein
VAAGANHSLVLLADGTLWAFGRNRFGQLGVASAFGTDTPTNAPALVMSSVTSMAGGAEHTTVLKSDGQVWAFGYNRDGQLGNDDTFATNLGRWMPQPIAGPPVRTWGLNTGVFNFLPTPTAGPTTSGSRVVGPAAGKGMIVASSIGAIDRFPYVSVCFASTPLGLRAGLILAGSPGPESATTLKSAIGVYYAPSTQKIYVFWWDNYTRKQRTLAVYNMTLNAGDTLSAHLSSGTLVVRVNSMVFGAVGLTPEALALFGNGSGQVGLWAENGSQHFAHFMAYRT